MHFELMTAAARQINTEKLWSILSALVAIRLKSSSVQNTFPIRCPLASGYRGRAEALCAYGMPGDDDPGAAAV